jgi:hypothetical protein
MLPKNRQILVYEATKSIFYKALRVGQEIRIGRYEAHLFGRSAKIARAGVGTGAEGNLIQEAPLSLWANFRQQALDVAIQEINNKTDGKIEVESIQRAKHRRIEAVTFAIEEQEVQGVSTR